MNFKHGAARVAAVTVLAGAALGAVQPATAWAQASTFGQARTFSLGLVGTATHWRVDCPQTSRCDRNDAGWRLTGAWHFAPQGALELVAAEQGHVHAEAATASGLQTTDLQVRGTGLGLAWMVPLNRDWWAVARAGVLANRARWTENAGGGAADVRTSNTRTDPMLGLGLSWRVTPSVSVDGRFDWTSTRLQPASGSLLGGGSTGSHQWGLGLSGYF